MKASVFSLLALAMLMAPLAANASTEMTVAPHFASVEAHLCTSLVAMDATNQITMEEIQVCAETSPSMGMTIQQLAAQHPVYVTGHMTGILQWKKFVIDRAQMSR